MLDAWWVNLLTRKSKFQMEIHHDVTQNWRKDPTPTTDLLYVSKHELEPSPPGLGFKHTVSQFWVAYKSVTA